MARLDSISFIHTRKNIALLTILRNEGFISGWSENILESDIDSFADYDVKDFQQGKVLLRYTQGQPLLKKFKLFQKEVEKSFSN